MKGAIFLLLCLVLVGQVFLVGAHSGDHEETLQRMLDQFDEVDFKEGMVIFSFDEISETEASRILKKYGLVISEFEVCGPVAAVAGETPDEGSCSWTSSWSDATKIAYVFVGNGKEKHFSEKIVLENDEVLWAEPEESMEDILDSSSKDVNVKGNGYEERSLEDGFFVKIWDLFKSLFE